MSGDSSKYETEAASYFRKPDHSLRYPIKTALISRTKHQWTAIVGLEDGDLLDRVLNHFLKQIIGNDNSERLSGKIDVLLVFGHIGRNGLVAKLAQLDADFFGGNPVSAIANHGPDADAYSIGFRQLCKLRHQLQHRLYLCRKGF